MKFCITLLLIILFVNGCGKNNNNETKTTTVPVEIPVKKISKTGTTDKSAEPVSKNITEANTKPPKKQIKEVPEIKVIFIELGSVNCIPCKMMQPIMEEIEEEYVGQVKILFYDVWTQEGRPYAREYRIRVIPTQVFLDKDGNEYFRHEGYFPKDELIKVLKMKGVE
ncbi:MAG: thioredoxin family protein [Bacteroidota bacterium]